MTKDYVNVKTNVSQKTILLEMVDALIGGLLMFMSIGLIGEILIILK